MPFRSKAQVKFLYSQKPDIAKKFAEDTPKSTYKKLKEHVDKKRKKK